MKDQEALQRDFFIYVPEKDALQVEEVAMGGRADLPPGLEDWVKIPVSGQLVVYAHILDANKVGDTVALEM